ncbi:MAG: RICIN domain-containing protein [Acidobacteria bacterium]|nr:RICIN domain-containing protein [Acidobacteriota bacterium]
MKKQNLIALLMLFVGLAGSVLAQQYQQARREERELILRELRSRIYNDERRDYDVRIETAESAYSNRDETLVRGRARISSGGANWQTIWYEGSIDVRRNRASYLRWGYDDNRGGNQGRDRDRYDDRSGQSGVLREGRYEMELVATRRLLSVGRDGRTVVQASGSGRYSQWDLQDAGNGSYYILSADTGEALTVAGRGESGDDVILTRLQRGNENQLWLVRPGPDNGYSFSTRRGKTLDSPSSARFDGGRMQIYNHNGEANQRFVLRQVDGYGRDRDSNRDRDYRNRDRDQGYGGYGQGSLIWRGRVDDVTILEIRDRSVRDRVISGQPAQRVDYNFSSALPRSEVRVSVDKRRGRGEVRVVEQPNRRNGYTAIIEIRDSSGGAADYEIEVRWN